MNVFQACGRSLFGATLIALAATAIPLKAQDANDKFVTGIYIAVLNRNPDPSGWIYYTGYLRSGTLNRDQLTGAFLASQEFANACPGGPTNNGVFLQCLYLHALNRPYDQGGYDFWLGLLNSGYTQVWVTQQFVGGDEFRTVRAAQLQYRSAYTTATSVNTIAGPGRFTVHYTNAYGPPDIAYGYVLFNNNPNGPDGSGCMVLWDIYGNLALLSPSGQLWGSVGQSTALQNQYCIIDPAHSQKTQTSDGYDVTVAVIFTDSFAMSAMAANAHQIYGTGLNTEGLASAWNEIGAWDPQSTGPTGGQIETSPFPRSAASPSGFYADGNAYTLRWIPTPTNTVPFSLITSCQMTSPDGISGGGTTLRNFIFTDAYVQFDVTADRTAPTGPRILTCRAGSISISQVGNPYQLWDVTPTVASISPSPLELDINTTRTFTFTGAGFGRATNITLSAAVRSVQLIESATPQTQFSLIVQAPSTPVSAFVTIKSLGNSPAGFNRGPNSPTDSVTLPMMLLVKPLNFTVKLYGVQIADGAIITLDANEDPALPLQANVFGVNTTGNNFSWRVQGSYTDPLVNNGNCVGTQYVPRTWQDTATTQCTIGANQPCTFSGLATGGTVSVDWQVVGDTAWTRGISFQVVGVGGQPTKSQVFQFMDTFSSNTILDNPWFLRWIPNAESAYSQFNSNGSPVYGCPHGYGLMQVDPPDSTSWLATSVIYDWQTNVLAAKEKATVMGFEARDFTDRQYAQMLRDMGTFVPPPDIFEGACTFTETAVDDPVESLRTHTFRPWHVNWLKRYNGGYYLSWSTEQQQWITNALSNTIPPFNYVNRVCSRISP